MLYSLPFLAVLSADMVKDGYNDICNIDISPFVVESMAEKYKKKKELKCTFHWKRDFVEAAAASIYVSSAAIAKFSQSFPLNYLRSKQSLGATNTIPDLKIPSDIRSHYYLSTVTTGSL